MTTAKKSSSNQGDLLLWIAGAAIAAVGAAWLAIMQPWKGSGDEQELTLAVATTPSAATPPALTAPAEAVADDAAAAPEAGLDNPLRMAQLAYDAGMLVEPDEYSAWTLFARVLKSEPGNAAALEGLTKVADDLVRRGETALDQGRFDDARATVERIRAVLPNHAGAKALVQKIFPVTDVRPTTPPLPAPEAERVAKVETAPAPPPKPAVDPVVEASQAIFGRGELGGLDSVTLDGVAQEVPSASLGVGATVIDALVETGLVESRAAARRAIAEGGAYVNNVRVDDDELVLGPNHALDGGWIVVRRGKKSVGLVRAS